MNKTKTEAQQLYQHLEKMFDIFWKEHKDNDQNYLASELTSLCRETSVKIRDLVKEYCPVS